MILSISFFNLFNRINILSTSYTMFNPKFLCVFLVKLLIVLFIFFPNNSLALSYNNNPENILNTNYNFNSSFSDKKNINWYSNGGLKNNHIPQPNKFNLKKYFSNFLYIPYNLGKEILRFDPKGLKRNIIVASTFASLIVFDQSIRNFTQKNIFSGKNYLTGFLYKAGFRTYILPAHGLAYCFSFIGNNRYLRHTVFYSFQSLVISAGLTEIAKKTVQRVRPRNSPDNPFNRKKGSHSFFSGHTSAIWSIMTVVADRYPSLKYAAYGLASAVSIARIYEDAHWASDVFAGAIIAYAIGKLTLKMNLNVSNNLSFSSYNHPNAKGVSICYRF